MSQTIHFRGLNGIRAICALSVVVSHSATDLSAISSYKGGILPLAGFAVTAFFSLSGFLITFLLLSEKDNGEISIKQFYARRILRIWPLYYSYMLVALAFSFFVLKEQDFSSIWYYVFFVPNIPNAYHLVNMNNVVTIGILNHFWSLGVEEQFYAFYPHLVKFSKNILKMCILLFCVVYSIKIIAKIYSIKSGNPFWYSWADNTRFDAMAIGGTGAWIFKNKKELAAKVYQNRIIQVLAAIVLFLIAINRFHIFTTLDHVIAAIITVLVIYYAHCLDNPIFNLDNKVLNSLGKISFGIYVYHPLMLIIAQRILAGLGINEVLKVILYFILVIVLTISIAYFSFHYFESFFLRKKLKYSPIKSSA